MGELSTVGNDSTWKYEKIFAERNFFGAGQLIILSRQAKPSKNTEDNTYVALDLRF